VVRIFLPLCCRQNLVIFQLPSIVQPLTRSIVAMTIDDVVTPEITII